MIAAGTLQNDFVIELSKSRSVRTYWILPSVYIIACQQGGVSNKPTLGSGQRQDTGSGIL